MNHRVHLCISGCLTLKLSLSWKTVICSSPGSPFDFGSLLAPAGEIGMVERSTGEVGLSFSLADAAMAAMIGRSKVEGRLICGLYGVGF